MQLGVNRDKEVDMTETTEEKCYYGLFYDCDCDNDCEYGKDNDGENHTAWISF